jgi:hypothetical protein
LNIDNACSITFEGVDAPKYYNYRNDSINIEIEIDMKWVYILIGQWWENFDIYIEDNYKSRSGFSSFYPHDASQWLNYDERGDDHKTGSMLQFILTCEDEQGAIDRFNEDTLDKRSCYLMATNYNELVEE